MKKALIAVLMLAGVALAQVGRTSSNILPATSGQTLGNQDFRWRVYALDLDVQGSLTCNGVSCSGTVVIPGPTSSRLGGVKTFDCSTAGSNYYPQKLNSDGTFDCIEFSIGSSHTQAISTITGLQTALDAKLNSSALNSTLIVSKFGGGSCSGYLKSDGTCDTPGAGTGTVTHTAGNLTSGAVMVGNGTNDSKVTGVTIDGSDAMTIPGGVGIGAGQPTVINVKSQTISTLPSSDNATGDHRQVSDGQSAADCTSGGGSSVHWCMWSGSAWVSEVASLAVSGSSGDLQTNNGSGGLGAVAQSTFALAGHAHTGMTVTVFSGSQALGTGAIASGACATAINVSATGVAATDTILADFNADPTSLTGYAAATTGSLTIYKWPSTDTVNIKVCNGTSASITPSAATLNIRVVR